MYNLGESHTEKHNVREIWENVTQRYTAHVKFGSNVAHLIFAEGARQRVVAHLVAQIAAKDAEVVLVPSTGAGQANLSKLNWDVSRGVVKEVWSMGCGQWGQGWHGVQLRRKIRFLPRHE